MKQNSTLLWNNRSCSLLVR